MRNMEQLDRRISALCDHINQEDLKGAQDSRIAGVQEVRSASRLEYLAAENARLWARIVALEAYLQVEFRPATMTPGAYVLKDGKGQGEAMDDPVCYTCRFWRPLLTSSGHCGRHFRFYRFLGLLSLRLRRAYDSCRHWQHVV